MHTRNLARRSTRRIILAVSFALVPGIVACPPPGPSSLPGPHAGLSGYPGENPVATKAYLSSLDFTQTDSIFDGWIQCHSATDCTGDSIHLKIVPEKNAHEVPIDAALHGGPGYIVSRIVNLDNKPYRSYRLAALDTGYLWTGAMPGGERRVAIFRISPVTGAASGLSRANKAAWCTKPPGMIRTIAAVHINSMTECNANTFYTALRDIGNDTHLASTSSAIVAGTLRGLAHSSGLWFSCSMGCCEASQFDALL